MLTRQIEFGNNRDINYTEIMYSLATVMPASIPV